MEQGQVYRHRKSGKLYKILGTPEPGATNPEVMWVEYVGLRERNAHMVEYGPLRAAQSDVFERNFEPEEKA